MFSFHGNHQAIELFDGNVLIYVFVQSGDVGYFVLIIFIKQRKVIAQFEKGCVPLLWLSPLFLYIMKALKDDLY